MFITYYQTLKNTNISNDMFFKLLENPNIDISNYKPSEITYKKTTKNILEKYGKNYLNKHPIKLQDLNLWIFNSLPINEIKNHYYSFKIPKKTNPQKYRKIDAPDNQLKTIQTLIKTNLEEQIKVLPHNAAHAYVKGRSTITAIKEHQNNQSKWFLKLDLKDFFPSHNKEYILKMLNQIYPFAVMDVYQKEIIEKYIDYALLDNKLPQGTPLSPLLTNLCMVPIDFMITNTLKNFKKKHFVYTRYADDLLISCKYKFKPGSIIHIINKIFKYYETPFKINKEKTRFGSSAGRNWNLGIMLNKDNNITIGHKNNQKFRAMLFDLICNKSEWTPEKAQETLGLISYYKAIEPDYINYTIEKYNKKYNIDILKTLKNIIAKH